MVHIPVKAMMGARNMLNDVISKAIQTGANKRMVSTERTRDRLLLGLDIAKRLPRGLDLKTLQNLTLELVKTCH